MNKFIGKNEIVTTLHGFKRLQDGSLEYTTQNDGEIVLQDDNQNEVYDTYFFGINDGEFQINDRGQLIYKYFNA